MSKLNKQLSNPFSSGGGGFNFETRVQASFVTLMLSGGFAPCLPPWQIKKIKLQGKYLGYDTDDAIIYVESPDKKQERKLLCQIKHSINITKTNKIFGEVINSAWNDSQKDNLFEKGKDLIALITGPLSYTDINDTRTILEWARSESNAEEFLRKVNETNLSSNSKREKLIVFRTHLKNANNGMDVKDEDLWQFMKSIYLLGYDLDIQTGVTLSLLQSLIGQYSLEGAHSLWTQIVDEVQSANQNAGTITIDSIRDDIRSAFKSHVNETVPKDLGIKPTVPIDTNWNNFEFASELAIANLLGEWDEQSKSDREIIEQLTNEKYSDWISKVREILQWQEGPLSLKNGIWNVSKRLEMWKTLGARIFDSHLDKFKQCVIKVLMEPDPQFELSAEERYAANIHGKVLTHSHVLRKGLVESLTLLGNYPNELKNCLLGKSESIAITSVREIFKNSNWILWGSLNNLLPTLAEAAPEEFLNAVEITLRKTPCPFEELFSQEGKGMFGRNYMTGLLWALENLAWDEKYLVRVTVILGNLDSRDPGGNWGNRPSHSLTTIFLPWMPQTIAPPEKRIVAVKTLIKEFHKVAWNLLLSLLPTSHQVSSGSHKPTWRKIIPEDWKKGVSKEEYWDQVSSYANLAVEMAKNDLAKLREIIDNLDNLTEPAIEKLLVYLQSSEIINLNEEERTPIWKSLFELVIKHKKFKDTDWALNIELVEKIERVVNILSPQKPQNLYNRLFAERDFNLFEESGNWEEQEKKLKEKRTNAIQEIIKHDGLQEVLRFAEIVDSPRIVGYSLGFIDNSNIDSMILPDLLNTENNKLLLLTGGFVWGRYQYKKWDWVDHLNTSNWSNTQILNFLLLLPFSKETWERVETLLCDNEDKYWQKIDFNPYQAENNLDFAIDKLLKNNRPIATVKCIHANLHLKKTLDNTKAIKALLSTINSTEPVDSMGGFDIIEIIKALQNDPETDQDELFNIEWAYLPLLTGPTKRAVPKILEQKVASDPDFFCELIRAIYRSKNRSESEKETTEQQKFIASRAWKLLNDWSTLPGKQPDGTFSDEMFRNWLDKVENLCKESGHYDVALIHIGEMLIHYVPDTDGFWIHRTIARALDEEDAEKMRSGFRTGIFNSRGVHAVDPTGKPEKELAKKYRQQAEEVENAGYFRFASTLRGLAESYEYEAKRIIDEHEDLNNKKKDKDNE
jgi:hypothetical protein